MPVMFFDHARIGVTELASNDGEWRTTHYKAARVRMAQFVKCERREPGSFARPRERALLVGTAPRLAIRPLQENFPLAPTAGKRRKKGSALHRSNRRDAVYRSCWSERESRQHLD